MGKKDHTEKINTFIRKIICYTNRKYQGVNMHADFKHTDFLNDFIARFKNSTEKIHVFRSPARINLIGEHIDYNGGKVFPAAIDRYLSMAIRLRDDDTINIQNQDIQGSWSFTIPQFHEKPSEASWISYLRGVFHYLFNGKWPDRGFDALFTSNVHMGAGVSSSAALELCFAYGLSWLYKLEIPRLDLVHISRKAEHEYAGVHCGIMDQYAVAFGKAEHALLLDTSACTHTYAPVKLGDYVIMLINTNKPRSLADSKYNERLEECQKALTLLRTIPTLSQCQNLCDIPPDQFEQHKAILNNANLERRVRHCIYENQRVLASVDVLNKGDLKAFGKLLIESHISLRENYEVTGLHLDTIFESARSYADCIGVRMTGAGFGGCAIALIKKTALDDFARTVGSDYKSKTGLEATFYPVTIGEGVHELE